MRLPRRWIYDPTRNAGFAAPAVALSVFVFAYSVLFGPILVLAFYACWLPAFLVSPRILLDRPTNVAPLLALPAAAVMSTLWSDAFSVTLRASIQYATTVVCGLIAARLVSVPSLCLGGAVGGAVVLLYSAGAGDYAYNSVDGSYAFRGAFGSKNQLGYFATLVLMFSTTILFLFRAGFLLRIGALAAAALALVMLAMSDSATSILSVGATFVVIAAFRFLVGLGPRQRAAVIAAAAAGAAAAAVAALRLGAFASTLGAFGKDETLTGRTYLWNRGVEIGSGQPWLGHGYDAFWTKGRPEAEELWREFYIASRTGFHFHNVYIEAFVGLGALGLVLTGFLALALLLIPIRAALRPLAGGSTIILAGLSLLFLIRSTVEVDFLTPHTAGAFLVPFVLLKLADAGRVGSRRVSSPISPGRGEPCRAGMRSSSIAG